MKKKPLILKEKKNLKAEVIDLKSSLLKNIVKKDQSLGLFRFFFFKFPFFFQTQSWLFANTRIFK